MNNVTEQLAAFASGLQYDALPGAVALAARMSLLNFLACAIAGAGEDVVERSINAFSTVSCDRSTPIIARRERFDPATATYLNALSATVLAFDETHARSIVHPVAPVAAAIAAMASIRPVDGKTFMAALVAGIELSCRASLAISATPARGLVGWSQTAICGAPGAAAAVGRLLGLDAVGVRNAIALGANSSAGLRAMNGTMGATVAASNAAANGFRAALLASAGVEGSRQIFEDPYGFVSLYAHEGHLPYLTDALGEDFALSDLAFKRYPCGVVAHASIEAAQTIRSRQGFFSPEIVDIEGRIHSSCLSLGDRPAVSSDSEASVSIQYWIATALLRSDLGPQCLKPEWREDADREKLQQTVRLIADDSLSPSSASLTVRLASGRELTAEITGADGGLRPMNWDDISLKFATVAKNHLSDAIIQACTSTCANFELLDDTGLFLSMLADPSLTEQS